MPDIQLRLGNVTFADFELPEEIDHFGGLQNLAKHKFPGGIITVQELGAFPPDIIRWSGVFMNYDGVDLNDRIRAIDQMRTSGQQQLLSYGQFNYDVIVWSFATKPRNIFQVPYTIELVTFDDLTQTSIAPPVAPGQVANIQQQNSSLQNTITNGNNLVVPPPPPTLTSLTNFQQALSNALQQASSNPGTINTPKLQGQLDLAQAELQPLLNNQDSGVSSFALQASNTLTILDQQLNPAASNLNTIPALINPNLFQLAEQYYSDATQWEVIAKANQLMTPFPVGIFRNLIIPQLQSV